MSRFLLHISANHLLSWHPSKFMRLSTEAGIFLNRANNIKSLRNLRAKSVDKVSGDVYLTSVSFVLHFPSVSARSYLISPSWSILLAKADH